MRHNFPFGSVVVSIIESGAVQVAPIAVDGEWLMDLRHPTRGHTKFLTFTRNYSDGTSIMIRDLGDGSVEWELIGMTLRERVDMNGQITIYLIRTP